MSQHIPSTIRHQKWKFIVGLVILLLLYKYSRKNTETQTLLVTVTAYNSLPEQTHRDHPPLAAWGDTLEPGMKAIAVSRDLIPLGLTHNTEVSIEGLPGTYRVLDKMNRRWRKRIDIYMGIDRKAALQWGKQKLIISWEVELEQ